MDLIKLEKFPFESLRITGLLKDGYFSCIHLGQCATESNTVVLKIFKEEKSYDAFDHDTTYIKNVIGNKNDNIVNIIGYFTNPKLHLKGYVISYETFRIRGRTITDLQAYLIFIRENFTTVEDLSGDYEISFTPHDEELHTFAIQIAKGCEYLHENGIIHGDLAARNILLDQRKTIKITDFGLLALKNCIIKCKDVRFSCRWSSLECLHPGSQSSKESDVWSFGVVLWEIGTLGGLPFHDYTVEQLESLRTYAVNQPILEIENGTYQLRELIKLCLKEEPSERPNFPEIREKLMTMNCLEGRPCDCKLYISLKCFNRNNLTGTSKIAEANSTSWEDLTKHNWKYLNTVKVLGYGSFGSTTLLKFTEPKTACYWFVVKKQSEKYFRLKDGSFRRNVMATKNHPNVAKIIAIYPFKKALLIEYQSIFLGGGKHVTGLQKYLQHLRQEIANGNDVDTKELGWFCLQIARGMAHLHKKQIVHGNLAARNVLINNAKIVKITDYFNFKTDGQGSYTKPWRRENLSPCRWASPELIKTGESTFKTDVWAFGVVLWEIATLGACPHHNFKSEQLLEVLADGKILLEKTEHIKEELWAYMTSYWDVDPPKRPDFRTIEAQLLSSTSKTDLFRNFHEQEQAGASVNFLPMESVEEKQHLESTLSSTKCWHINIREIEMKTDITPSLPQYSQSFPLPEERFICNPFGVELNASSEQWCHPAAILPFGSTPSPRSTTPFPSPDSFHGDYSMPHITTQFRSPEPHYQDRNVLNMTSPSLLSESPDGGRSSTHAITQVQSPDVHGGNVPCMTTPFQFLESPEGDHIEPCNMINPFQYSESSGTSRNMPDMRTTFQSPGGCSNSQNVTPIPFTPNSPWQSMAVFPSPAPPSGYHGMPRNIIVSPVGPNSPWRPCYGPQCVFTSALQSPNVSNELEGVQHLQDTITGFSIREKEFSPPADVQLPSETESCQNQNVSQQILVPEMHNPIVYLPWCNLQPLPPQNLQPVPPQNLQALPPENLQPLPIRFCLSCKVWTNLPTCNCMVNWNKRRWSI